MVFSNLSPSDKEAFFGLLDEYFASRPEVAQALHASSPGNASAAIASVASAYNRSPNIPPSSTVPAWKQQANGQSQANGPPELPPSIGRVAAAAAAFRTNGATPSPPSAPPRPPARNLSNSYETTENSHEGSRPAYTPSTDRLVSHKKFGDVDVTSAKNMYSSIRHGTANKTAVPPPVAPPIPSALPPIKNEFGPPPVRRVSATNTRNTVAQKTASPPPPPPPRPRVEEPQVEGDWAEALYDYSSEDPGDLELRSGQQILILERTSGDWWTGEFEGRRGLVPAAYVKLL